MSRTTIDNIICFRCHQELPIKNKTYTGYLTQPVSISLQTKGWGQKRIRWAAKRIRTGGNHSWSQPDGISVLCPDCHAAYERWTHGLPDS